MDRILIAIASIILIVFTGQAYAHDVAYDKVSIEASQQYLRQDMNDSIELSIQLLHHDCIAKVQDVPIVIRVMNNRDSVYLDRNLLITDSEGRASTIIKIAEGAEFKDLPLLIQISASTDNNYASLNTHIVDTGNISGFIVENSQNTILNAKLTVYEEDGKAASYLNGPFYSSNGSGSLMGAYRIENIPLNIDTFKIVSEKDGFSNTTYIKPDKKETEMNIVIGGYMDMGRTPALPGFMTSGTNASATPSASATASTMPMPTLLTNNIILIIILLSVVFFGLKVYRKMF